MNTCKVCGEKYTGGVFLELVCSYGCAEVFYSKIDELKRKEAAFDWMVKRRHVYVTLMGDCCVCIDALYDEEIGFGANELEAIEDAMKREKEQR